VVVGVNRGGQQPYKVAVDFSSIKGKKFEGLGATAMGALTYPLQFILVRRGPWVRVPVGSPVRTRDRNFKTTFILVNSSSADSKISDDSRQCRCDCDSQDHRMSVLSWSDELRCVISVQLPVWRTRATSRSNRHSMEMMSRELIRPVMEI
jgi:hypothetical protein